MQANYMICNCKQVSYIDIANALESHTKFENVLEVFEDIQKQKAAEALAGALIENENITE